MDLTVLVRAIHVAATILVAGAFAFQFFVVRGSREREWAASVDGETGSWLRSCVLWSGAIALLSWLLWLALVAASMSGSSLGQALRIDVLGTVLARTTFGHVWLLRFSLMVLLGLELAWRRRGGDGPPLGLAAALIAAALLASLAWAGHAVGTERPLRPLHLTADALHLLGAGLWLGALVPLFFVLSRARTARTQAWSAAAARATAAFSRLGLFAVATLLVSGAINAWLLVRSVAALADTGYGQLVAVKLALFLAIIAIAAVNRLRLAPRLQLDEPQRRQSALDHLWRNVILELALGAIIVAIVGVLGRTPPSFHKHSSDMPHTHVPAD
ncbi:MAG TPA: copper homeostasis membrane protein CopD [Ramlibacter sp.]|nr:copper homeostasis membrane protein CopD [Ramlibacter sp.]